MTELIPIYRYRVERAGAPTETRWSLAPLRPSGYAGEDEPSDAHPMGNEPAQVGQMQPAGHVEVPDGTTILSMDPPILDIPGQGHIALEAVIGVGGGAPTPPATWYVGGPLAMADAAACLGAGTQRVPAPSSLPGAR